MAARGGVITMEDCRVIIQRICSWNIVGNVFVDFTKEYMYFSHYTIDGERGGGGCHHDGVLSYCHIIIQEVCLWSIVGNVLVDFTKE